MICSRGLSGVLGCRASASVSRASKMFVSRGHSPRCVEDSSDVMQKRHALSRCANLLAVAFRLCVICLKFR